MKAILQEPTRKLTNIVFRAYLEVFSWQLAMKIGLIELYKSFITIAVRLTYCGRQPTVPIVRWQSSKEMKQLKSEPFPYKDRITILVSQVFSRAFPITF